MHLKYLIKYYKSKSIWIIKILISIIFAFVVNRAVSFSSFKTLQKRIELSHLFLTFLLGLIGILLQIQRWKFVLKISGHNTTFGNVFKSFLWGNTLGFITPARAGELFRGVGISSKKFSDSVITVLLDKLLILGTTLICGFACSLLWLFFFPRIQQPWFYLLIELFVVLLFIIFLRLITLAKFKLIPIWSKPYLDSIRSFVFNLFSKEGINCILYSLIAHITLLVQTTIVFNMLGINNYVVSFTAAAQSYLLMCILPISIANIGIREYSFFYFLSHFKDFHLSDKTLKTVSLEASLIILVINIIFPALIGLILMFSETLGKNNNNCIKNNLL